MLAEGWLLAPNPYLKRFQPHEHEATLLDRWAATALLYSHVVATVMSEFWTNLLMFSLVIGVMLWGGLRLSRMIAELLGTKPRMRIGRDHKSIGEYQAMLAGYSLDQKIRSLQALYGDDVILTLQVSRDHVNVLSAVVPGFVPPVER